MKQKTQAQEGGIEQLIYEETERRLEIMQSDSYEFPKKMTRVDYGIIIASVAASLVLIVTCMLGG
ncbi:MAG TPA: hypothetical protein OIM37_05720 [Clostridiales bacterium]|nr:hypothetical protein [Clostridiales bacterium]HJI90526.1 hypothetical protein [Clostridiales bacterium]